MKIPIRNVYYLLLYAWDHVGEGEEEVGQEERFTHLHEMFAHVLAVTTARLLARGLDRQYREVEAVIGGVRGKLDLNATLKRNHLAGARTHCRFDELQYDVLHNRILKSTLRALLELELGGGLPARIRRLHRKMDAVADVRISRRDFGRVQLHRNNRAYDFALRLCRLIHDNLMIEAGTGRTVFRDFRRDARQMGALFEAFVYHFFTLEQRRYRVSRPHIAWHDAQGSETDLQRLPVMRTDVLLEAPDRRIILDTKFYAEALRGRFESRKVDSGHLYQILAYVQNRAAALGAPHEGLLLYPVVEERFSFDYRLHGHPIGVRSIDLDQPWPAIRSDLLALIEEPRA